MNKRGVKFGIVLSLIVGSSKLEVQSELEGGKSESFNIQPSTFNSYEEEKARLEQELADLQTQLAQIDNENFAKFHFGYADYFFQKSVGGIHSTNLTFFKVLNGTWVNFYKVIL